VTIIDDVRAMMDQVERSQLRPQWRLDDYVTEADGVVTFHRADGRPYMCRAT
jgi:hypothetical protein